MVVKPVSSDDRRAATATLRDSVEGLLWQGPLVSELAVAEVAEVGELGPLLSQRRSAGPIPTVKAVAWAVWGQRRRGGSAGAQVF